MNRLLLPLFLVALPGCDFFATPAELDGLLSCDEEQPLDVLSSVDLLLVDAEAPVGLTIRPSDLGAGEAAVLQLQSASESDNIGAVWDPEAGAVSLAGSLTGNAEGRVKLFAPGGGALSGSLTMTCGVAEDCGNLTDDDGDGRVDCADAQCARTDACELGQVALEVARPACSDDFVPLAVPTLRVIDEQMLLYASDLFAQPLSLWSGAELVIDGLPPTGTGGVLRFASAGLACFGGVDGELRAVDCAEAVQVEAGDELAYGDQQVWLEPRGAAWEGVSARVDCGVTR